MSQHDHLTRRGFLGTTSAAAVPVAAAGQPGSQPGAENASDLTRRSAALEADQVVATACQFCNSLCRLNVHMKAGRIIRVKGEERDPVQAGQLCVKGETLMTELVYNPRRLRYPMRRVAGEKGSKDTRFERVSWETALEMMAVRFLELRDQGEARAIANRTSGRLPRGTGSLVSRFFELLGSPNDTDVGPVCNDAGGNALEWTFGLGNFTNGYGKDEATGREDLGSARMLLFLGTNQAETHPVTFAYLQRMREKTKARLVVIDPRLTATGACADEWIAPKPHTDLALVLAVLQHIIARGLHDEGFVRRWVLGFAQLREHLNQNGYTPDWAEKITDVPAEAIRRLAETYARTRPAAIFCNAGISHQLSAFDTYRALAFLAAVTGNIGVAGGGCNFMHNTWPGNLYLPPIEGAATPPARDMALPVGPDWFAESILTGKPYALRALVTEGNPLLASANTRKVQEAFRKLDFYVYTGLFAEEASWYADLLLPVCSGFEMETVYMRRDDRAIRWQNQVTARVGEAKPDWEIWLDLAQTMSRLDKKNPPEYWTRNLQAEWKDYRMLWDVFLKHTPAMGGMTRERMSARVEPLRWPCPTRKHPGVSTLYLDHPSWYEAALALSTANRGKRFLTPSGKVEIFTAEIERKLAVAGHGALPVFYTHPEVTGNHPVVTYTSEMVKNPVNPRALTPKVRLRAQASSKVHEQFPLMGMIGRPSVVHFAGVTQWTQTGKIQNGVRLIQIHPETARGSGIANGDGVTVESPRGVVTGTALLWEGIRKDTVFVPNTFGPAQEVGDDVGLLRYEAANTLVSDQYFDNLSGQQAYKCFACRVRKNV